MIGANRKAPTVTPNVAQLVPYSPGKLIAEVKQDLGLDRVVKLASNENSLGPSPRAVEAMRAAASELHLYPDAGSTALRQALGKHLSIDPSFIVTGNGSDEIIHYLGLAYLNEGDQLIQGDPSFVRYEASATLNRAECIKVPLKDWRHDLEAMSAAVTDRTRLIYIANPNNPTGTYVTATELMHFLDTLPDKVITVLDEAYYEYAEAPDYPLGLAFVLANYNVVLLRTFSKAYGLAGLRVGYAICRPEIAHAINQVREPFNVSSIGQAAAIAALADTDHLEATLSMNSSGKAQIYAGVQKLGLEYTNTEANFVWVNLNAPSQPIYDKMLRQGVIVRAGAHVGSPTHLRITIGTTEENQIMLNALKKALE